MKVAEPEFSFVALRTAGTESKYMIILTGVSVCGSISDGVSVSFSNLRQPSAGFVVPFEALERAYLANLEFRKANPETVATAERLGEEVRKLL